MTSTRRVDAADKRRAAALVTHYLDSDREAAEAIVEEANESDRTTELLVAVVALMAQTLTELRSPVGVRVVRSHLLNLAAAEEQPDPQGRCPCQG